MIDQDWALLTVIEGVEVRNRYFDTEQEAHAAAVSDARLGADPEVWEWRGPTLMWVKRYRYARFTDTPIDVQKIL